LALIAAVARENPDQIDALSGVIAGLDPAIHDAFRRTPTARIPLPEFIMDPRVKPAGDGCGVAAADFIRSEHAVVWWFGSPLHCFRTFIKRTSESKPH
jgi:hypothetical protein